MRGSLFGCKVDADTSVYSAKTREQKTSEKEYISKHKRMSKSRKRKKGIVCTSSSSRHHIQSLSHGLLSLEMLLLASVKAFSAFFALASADLVDFLALALAIVVALKAFLEASSSASSDEMRALAVARASTVHQGGTEKSSKERHARQANIKKGNLPLEALAAFRYSTHSLPKASNFLIKFCPENRT
jgi:hypothetical protein